MINTHVLNRVGVASTVLMLDWGSLSLNGGRNGNRLRADSRIDRRNGSVIRGELN